MLSSALPGYQFNNFSDFLANTLRVGTDLRVYHVSTPPTPTASIYASPPGKQDEPTTCESHFLAVSQPHAADSAEASADTAGTNGNESTKTEHHVLVFGIEVLIFTTNSLTTIFVSKADSSGFLTRPTHSTKASSSIIRTVTSAFLQWLVHRNLSPRPPEPSQAIRHEVGPRDAVNDSASDIKAGSVPNRSPGRRRLVLSLFARSQNQYLFPGSVENTAKHVLDDRQLIKWWCRVLDGLVERARPAHGYTDPAVTLSTSAVETNINDPGSATSAAVQRTTSPSTPFSATTTTTASIEPQAYIIVPGCDRSDTIRSFFPPSARYSRPDAPPRWHNSYPDQYLVGADTWQSGSDTDTSTTLPVRCMIPHLPDDPKARYCEDLDHAGTDELGRWRDIRSLHQFWETMEYRQECAAGRLVGFLWIFFTTNDATAKTANGLAPFSSKPDSELSRDHAQPDEDLTTMPAALDSNAAHPAPSELAPTCVILSAEQYNTLASFLLNHTDFAGPTLAHTSTQAWIAKAKDLSGAATFGVDVEGRAHIPAPAASAVRADSGVAMMRETEPGVGQKHARDESEADSRSVKVNVLTGIKKKRKAEGERSAVSNGHGPTLTGGNGIVSADDKQEKLPSTEMADGEGAPVRTLSAGLVRKKQKVSPSPSTL
ncbi:hypothetical protein LTR70_008797 [Exophiala xenobiotica]|uniref:histone acetyltransferase n=1 Tax=Lithohypha guttulata TaxID=1690604 RepID=A0ABR0JZ90_9EURO|nr:hypothetical protein LTR24_008668 [Lithohypha guttulata]KAK5311436.1 hypothetical protein LTR70_008797 [Exophiala xenobiotica]